MGSKKQILLIAGGIVALALVAVAAYLLYGGISEFSRTELDLQNAMASLERFYARNPFPSAGNVSLAQRNVRLQDEWFERIMNAYRSGQVQSEERSPSIFMGRLGATRTRMQACARTNGTIVADSTFGFGRYFAAGGELPKPDEVPRLTEQLLILEDLCGLLFEEKVTSLQLVTREQFEGSGAKDASIGHAGSSLRPIYPGRPASPVSSAPNLSERANAGMIEEGEVFGRYRFVFSLAAREAVLWNVLNRLASHGMFIVVTGVKIEKDQPDVKPAPPRVEKSAEPGAAEPPAVGQYRVDRVVCGPQFEQPMRITIHLDVYKFKAVGEG